MGLRSFGLQMKNFITANLNVLLINEKLLNIFCRIIMILIKMTYISVCNVIVTKSSKVNNKKKRKCLALRRYILGLSIIAIDCVIGYTESS